MGLLPKAQRTNGQRRYDASIIEKLAVIQLAKLAGFDLEETRAALSRVGTGEPGTMWRAVSRDKRVDLDRRISWLTGMKGVLAKLGACSCASLEDCGRAFNAARARRR